MKTWLLRVVVPTCLCWAAVGVGTATAKEERIDQGAATPTNARITTAADDPAARVVTFEKAPWPSVGWKADTAWDWSAFGFLTLTLANPGEGPIAASVRIDDDVSADGRVHCRTGRMELPPGATTTFAIRFGPDPMDVGMRGLPGLPGAVSVNAQGQAKLALDHIVAFQIFLTAPEREETLVVKSLALVEGAGLDGIVDRFGQYTGAEWPGKLHEEAEFAIRRDQEASDLAATPVLPGRDRFGGWAEGPKLEATGFFRTARYEGRWWLVDPDGRLFFSSGIDCVDLSGWTILTGREAMFTWLPAPGDPLARYLSTFDRVHLGPVAKGRIFDFYQANQQRTYGPDWQGSWRDVALKRLPSWGFNTVGNWSSHEFHGNGRVPYVATVTVSGRHARVSSGSDYWGQMHDPFDPQFGESVERSLRPVIERVKGDPWCVGVFVDNELSWGGFNIDDPRGRCGLALGALAAAPQQPARKAILEQLHGRHATIDQLNRAWGTDFAAWAAIEEKAWTPPEGPLSEGLQKDCQDFVSSLAKRYFQIVRDAQRAQDPDHLYLGCRFAWKTPEAIAAAAEFCDVVGFNIYRPSVDPREWAFLAEMGKPAIIGEYHVGALDRGMLHTGLVSSGSQEERAAIFSQYLRSVIDNPTLVGCHWFQYIDQPLTGRVYDGENYNIGFVSVTDTPYPEMVEAAREVQRTMYQRRAGQP